MRLGAYIATLSPQSLAYSIYGVPFISERHRHRYEVDISYKKALEEKGLIFSGLSKDGTLPEICEVKDKTFFLGVQFHPELKSQILNPHPIFVSLIQAVLEKKKN